MATLSGWVFQIKIDRPGDSSSGAQVLLPCFMVLDGRSISIYLDDPSENPEEKPVRRALAGAQQGVEDLGRRSFPQGTVLHVFRIFNKQDPNTAGLLGCTTAEAAQGWISALQHAQGEVEKEVRGSCRSSLELQDGSSRHWVEPLNPLPRFQRLVSMGKGILREKIFPAMMPSMAGEDAMESSDWRIFKVANGLRFFEDVGSSKETPNMAVMKAVGVVEAAADAVFELLMGTDLAVRSQWDPLTAETETIEVIDGHNDIVHSHMHAKYLKQWQRDRDVVYSRYWRLDQDGSYSITQFATTHPKVPVKHEVVRIDSSPGTWDIIPLPSAATALPRCLVRHTLELEMAGWAKWRSSYFADFEDTVPYSAFMRIAGLREYFAAQVCSGERAEGLPRALAALPVERAHRKESARVPRPHAGPKGDEQKEEFYECVASPFTEEEMLATSMSIERGLSKRLERLISRQPSTAEGAILPDLDSSVAPVKVEASRLKGSLREHQGPKDSSCWSDPGGDHFVVRGPTYLADKVKVSGGAPLLKLVAVDWYKAEGRVDRVAAQPGCLPKSEAGRKLPFLLVFNLQVPGKPNYSMVFYFAADRPIRKGSLLDKFVNGTDQFRNDRLKLIPRIVEGYWVVKRAVGTKACLLGKALTCSYLRQDNCLEIDCDIGSSSVARGVMGVVIGYVTSLVVDLAIVIQGEEEEELPEYLLGAMRVERLKLDDAVSAPAALL